jgi:hypothetical protein
MLASPVLAGGMRERKRKKGESVYPYCMRTPEWNFLFWLVEREKKREGGRLPFKRDQDQFQGPQHTPLIF